MRITHLQIARLVMNAKYIYSQDEATWKTRCRLKFVLMFVWRNEHGQRDDQGRGGGGIVDFLYGIRLGRGTFISRNHV